MPGIQDRVLPFGLAQRMLTRKTIQEHCINFGRVCAKLADEGDLGMLFGSEVRGLGLGFHHGAITVTDVLGKPFDKENLRFSELDDYLAMWGFGGASQPVVV